MRLLQLDQGAPRPERSEWQSKTFKCARPQVAGGGGIPESAHVVCESSAGTLWRCAGFSASCFCNKQTTTLSFQLADHVPERPIVHRLECTE